MKDVQCKKNRNEVMPVSEDLIMEKIGCKKAGGLIDLLEAVKYYETNTVCRSCPHHSICEEGYEEKNKCHYPKT